MGAGVAAWVSSAISLCKLLWNSIIGTSLSTSSHTEWVLSTIKLCEQVFPHSLCMWLDTCGWFWCKCMWTPWDLPFGNVVFLCLSEQQCFAGIISMLLCHFPNAFHLGVTVLATSGLPNILDLCCCSSWSVFLWMVLHFNVTKFQRGLQLVLALPSAHESFLGRCRLNSDK